MQTFVASFMNLMGLRYQYLIIESIEQKNNKKIIILYHCIYVYDVTNYLFSPFMISNVFYEKYK